MPVSFVYFVFTFLKYWMLSVTTLLILIWGTLSRFLKLYAEITTSYYVENRRQSSFFSCFNTPKQNRANYIQKIARRDGPCGTYVTGNTIERVHIFAYTTNNVSLSEETSFSAECNTTNHIRSNECVKIYPLLRLNDERNNATITSLIPQRQCDWSNSGWVLLYFTVFSSMIVFCVSFQKSKIRASQFLLSLLYKFLKGFVD